jgi:hypothetical protein
LAAEPSPQRARLELVDVAVEAGVRRHLTKLRSSESGECLKTSYTTVGMLLSRGGEEPTAPGVKVVFNMPCVEPHLKEAFMEDLSRRGPEVLWVQNSSEDLAFSIRACRTQSSRGKLFILELPVTHMGHEMGLISSLVSDGIGMKFQMNGSEAVTNWPQLRSEISRTDPCPDEVTTVVVKLLETQRLHSLEQALFSVLEEEGATEESTLQDPMIPWDMADQWDEITGKALDLEKVVSGRLKELKKFEERRVYVHVPRQEALRDEAGKFVKTRWVQTVKGEEVRCRLVAQEFAHGDPREDLFAGTPPLFSARMVVSRTANKRRDRHTLMVLDVSCAFLYAPIKRTVYIELPEEDPKSTSGEWVGKLEKALYGTRDAPQAWLEELGATLEGLGFNASAHYPGVYYHPGMDVSMVTHVDDLLCGGSATNLEWLRKELQKKYEVKGDIMSEECKQLKFLGRVISHDSDGFYWEEDPKHRRILLEEWGLKDCKGAATPMSVEKDSAGEVEMESSEGTRYRRAVARVNYLAQDRPDLSVAASVLSRSMAKPMVGDEVRLKRVLRYLKSHPSCRLEYKWQEAPKAITLLTDSDWAGDVQTRRSTTGMVIQLGGHLIHFASKLQKTVALSSGEAELNALVAGLTEALGVGSLCSDWQSAIPVQCFCDSSAARGIAHRTGVGKMKHLQVRQLWVQEQVRLHRATVAWIPRAQNTADAFTHQCSEVVLAEHLQRVGAVVRSVSSLEPARGGVLSIDPAYDWWHVPLPRCNWADVSGV